MEIGEDVDGDELQRRILESTLKEVAAREEQEADCCVICLEVISDPCEAVPCGHHNFDYTCAASWFFEHPSCPLCKTAVTGILHGPHGTENRPLTAVTAVKTTAGRASNERRTERTLNTVSRDHTRPRCRRPHRDNARAYRTTVSEGVAISARRTVYAARRYSMHVGSNRLSQYRELTPQLFCTDKALVSRARMWIRRELQVFSFLSPGDESGSSAATGSATGRTSLRRANNAEFLLEYIVAILKSVDIMGSVGQAEDMLADFLGRQDTRLFLHELRAWLRSPFTKLDDWDRAVQYGPPTAMPPTTPPPRQQQHPQGERDSFSSVSSRKERHFKGDFYRPGARRRQGQSQPRTGLYQRRGLGGPQER